MYTRYNQIPIYNLSRYIEKCLDNKEQVRIRNIEVVLQKYSYNSAEDYSERMTVVERFVKIFTSEENKAKDRKTRACPYDVYKQEMSQILANIFQIQIGTVEAFWPYNIGYWNFYGDTPRKYSNYRNEEIVDEWIKKHTQKFTYNLSAASRMTRSPQYRNYNHTGYRGGRSRGSDDSYSTPKKKFKGGTEGNEKKRNETLQKDIQTAQVEEIKESKQENKTDQSYIEVLENDELIIENKKLKETVTKLELGISRLKEEVRELQQYKDKVEEVKESQRRYQEMKRVETLKMMKRNREDKNREYLQKLVEIEVRNTDLVDKFIQEPVTYTRFQGWEETILYSVDAASTPQVEKRTEKGVTTYYNDSNMIDEIYSYYTKQNIHIKERLETTPTLFVPKALRKLYCVNAIAEHLSERKFFSLNTEAQQQELKEQNEHSLEIIEKLLRQGVGWPDMLDNIITIVAEWQTLDIETQKESSHVNFIGILKAEFGELPRDKEDKQEKE